jgi:hypothetical protein
MQSAYAKLFRVRLRHSFYASGESVDDFRVEPAPASRRTLQEHGLVFRPLDDGWAVYAEVEPDSSPPTLLRPLGIDALRLSFLLLPKNPYLWSISDLPAHRPGRSVFYLNNLRGDPADGRLHLGNSVAAERVGEALPLIAGETYTYLLATPKNTASFQIDDLFGNTLGTDSFTLPDAATSTQEHRLDLTKIQRLAAGLHTVHEDDGGWQIFYYDPQLFAARPFGVVEIFSRTDTLTPDGIDLVPVAYRFLDGDVLTGVEYTLQLDSRATSWRYNVVKKYGADGLQLEDLSIAGPVAFTKSVESDRAVFISDDLVALAESPQTLVLEENENRVRILPNPMAATPLQAGATDSYVSEINVYV